MLFTLFLIILVKVHMYILQISLILIRCLLYHGERQIVVTKHGKSMSN